MSVLDRLLVQMQGPEGNMALIAAIIFAVAYYAWHKNKEKKSA